FSTRSSTPACYTLSLHDALPIYHRRLQPRSAALQRKALRRGPVAVSHDPAHRGGLSRAAGVRRRATGTPAGRTPVIVLTNALKRDRKSTRLNSSHVKTS